MNKKDFMSELRKNLRGLSKEDKEEILEDYEEHFEVGKKKKRGESEIARSLGKPKQIAKQAKVELLVSKAEKRKSIGNIGKAVFATIGLSFFNLVFMVGPFFGLLGVVIALFATGFAITVSGISVIIAGFLSPLMASFIWFGGLSPLILILTGIGLASLGALFLIGTWFVAKWFSILTINYVKLNVRIINPERKE